jgi:hypothetical protein
MKTRILATLLLIAGLVIYGREQKVEQAVEFKKVSLDETMAQLRQNPNDSYLQYVAMILARNENRGNDIASEIEFMVGRADAWDASMGRRSQVDLFSIFTGALAVQESLQLDSMLGDRRRQGWFQSQPPMTKGLPKSALKNEPNLKMDMKDRGPVSGPGPVSKDKPAPKVNPPVYKDKGPPTKGHFEPQFSDPRVVQPDRGPVSVASLTGPTVKSHPWEQMLAGRKPEISRLARCVPEDFYFVEFRSVAKMLEAMEISDLWGTHLFNQAVREARTQKVGERLKTQLAIEATPQLRLFYDLVVSEAAVTGSDLFLREGSDVTLLFRFKQPELFEARMNAFFANAEKAHSTVKKTMGKYLEVEYEHLETPDRELSVYSAYPAPDLHVRSNSLVALQHVLEAIQGKAAGGGAVRTLGDSTEFAYIRTLMPTGAKEEDGLAYLSDPFIRKLVGPQLKLTERRRMLCYNHLRMIGHAALLYRTEHGRAPESLDGLAKAGCCPGDFNQGSLRCPDGGKYVPVKEVTGSEAAEYQAFVQAYNQYWRTFFDPIALRIQVSPERYRLETLVLPLIDNSIYTTLATVLGGKPENLDGLPVPKKNIFSVAFRFNKEKLLRESGLEELEPIAADQKPPKAEQNPRSTAAVRQCLNNLKLIGLAIHNYHDTYGRFPPAAILDKQKKPLLSWRVQLLPFLENNDLYQQFHLEEPWDSEHNKKLIARIPRVFQSPNRELTKAGKTTFLAPLGEKTLFPTDFSKVTFASVMDGTSNTIMIVDSDDDHASIWTKPEDLNYDPDKPFAGLKGHHKGQILSLFADGSVHASRDTMAKETIQALFTRNGGEVIPWDKVDEIGTDSPRPSPGRSFLGPLEQIGPENLQRFLTKGIGNQVALHVYDAVPMFDFNLPSAMSMGGGILGPGLGALGPSEIGISFLIASLNAPVYISVPILDERVVDEFLDKLDALAVTFAQNRERSIIPIDFDFYKLPLKTSQGTVCRSFGIRFGPVKRNILWARIDKGLYVASKPFILEDLIALEEIHGGEPQSADQASAGLVSHAMARVRAKNWNQVLPDFRLSWEENSRQACLSNLGPLSSVARAYSGATNQVEAEKIRELSGQIRLQADRLYTTHFFCPDGGEYLLTGDGKSMTCSIHGSAAAPRQLREPQGSLADLLNRFTGMTASLTFLDDGLHAVVTVDRK